MRITWLLEVADQLWGGVKVALEDANALARRGHDVTVVARSAPPEWMRLDCTFRRVVDFRPEHLPDADVLLGTFWTTVPWVASAGAAKGTPVHFCQGYEGDNPENRALRDRIEAVYRLPGMQHVTIAPHLTRLLRERFGLAPHEVRYAIDHRVHHAITPRPPRTPLRVGLVGPYQIPWKDLATGYEACRLAHLAGQKLVLVRATNTAPMPAEQQQPFAVEWHERLPPERMGDFYRSLDVFLATSFGAEEGFFLPAIEAMACGVPTVLTDVPCFRNHQALVGHDRYALFVPPRDPTAMAEALVIAGAMPDVRESLRRGGLEVASHYRPELHVEQLEATLQKIVASSRGAHSATATKPTQPRLFTAAAATAPRAATRAPTTNATTATLERELRQLANGASARGEHELAARAFEAAHCLAPEQHELGLAAAAARLASGAFDQALRAYDALAARGLDDAALHTGRGHALHALGRKHEAAQAFRTALALGPRTADAHNLLGVVLYEAGDVAAARQNFERALVLEPEHDDARANLESLPAA